MLPHDQFYTHPLYLKFQKTCRKLQQLLTSGKMVSAHQIAALTKRRNRYANQLLLLPAYAVKAGAVAGISLLLSGQIQAQTCNAFLNADSANPIRRAGLPQNLIQPTFIDIDGDGDLDCYESNANGQDGGGSKLKITFLRNTGSKKSPSFSLDSASGFGNTSSVAVPYNSDIDRTTFVDIDGDGDYDCFVGSYGYSRSGALFFKNTGTATKPKFVNTPSENSLSGISGSYGFQINFADLDADGDYDLTVSDLYKTRVFTNVGTKTSATFQFTFQSYSTYLGRATLYDYDKDGLTDLLVGNQDIATGDTDFSRFYRNVGTAKKPKFKYSKNGPSFPSGFVGLYTFVDLNNDGSAEAFSIHGVYATTSPVATIIRVSDDDPDVIALQANPNEAFYGYQWRKDGKIIPGATASYYPAAANGSYTVEITGSCGTGISLPYVITNGAASANRSSRPLTTSVGKTEVTPVVKAYPNPFTQQFSLYLGKNEVSNIIIRISDVKGKIISTAKANSTITQLGGNLPKGMYIVQLIQNNTVVFTQKIIKE